MTYGGSSGSGYNWRSNLMNDDNFTSFSNAGRNGGGGDLGLRDLGMPRNEDYISQSRDNSVGYVQQELLYLKQDSGAMKNAIMSLERDRDNLRQAIRKLKVENSRMKIKMKHMGESMKAGGLKTVDMETEGIDGDDVDYDSLTDYILIGGANDPLSLRHEVAIRDENGLEHKSAERFLWFKMAETFKDMDAGEKIRTAPTGAKAEEEMAKIKGFNEGEWNAVKMKFWEEGQRIKFDQVRHLQSLLVFTGDKYLAIGSQDKVWGTGWRKQRQEAWRPKMWDGENLGGKALIKVRGEMKANHTWMGPHEEQETEKKYNELYKSVWDKNTNLPATKRGGNFGGGGGRGGGFGGRGGFPSKRARRNF